MEDAAYSCDLMTSSSWFDLCIFPTLQLDYMDRYQTRLSLRKLKLTLQMMFSRTYLTTVAVGALVGGGLGTVALSQPR